MSKVDAAWLSMGDRTNLMVVTGILSFEDRLDIQRLKDVLLERLVDEFPRFRQRVEERAGPRGPVWVEDEHFDIDLHVQGVSLPPPGDRDELERLVGEVMSRDLDRDRPLWHATVVDEYRGGSVLVMRIHHAVADGISLSQVLLSMTEDADEDAASAATPAAGDGEGSSSNGDRGLDPLGLVRSATRTIGELWEESLEFVTDPSQVTDIAKMATRGVGAVGKIALGSADPPSPLKGELGMRKLAAWSDRVDLDDAKAIGRTVGGATVNDALVAAVSGALRRYLLDQGVEPHDVQAVIPVNLRPLDEPVPRDLGNKFGTVLLSLPVSIRDRGERIEEVKRRMDAIKGSPEAILSFGGLHAAGATPFELGQAFVDGVAAKATLVLTNMPGPQRTLALAGVPVDGVLSWPPQSGHLALGMSVFSYDGTVCVGVMSDASVIPEPRRIAEAFEHEFDAYVDEFVREETMAVE
jgi:diacylglycerol O-acyltransferase / wax synthase